MQERRGWCQWREEKERRREEREQVAGLIECSSIACLTLATSRSSSPPSLRSLIGEIDADKIPLLQKFHADFLDSLDMKEETDRMTGTLLVLNSCCFIELVEAPTKILVQLMRNLAEVSGWNKTNANGKMNSFSAATYPGASQLDIPSSSPPLIVVDPRHHPLLRSSAILSFTEEIPREYHIWAFRSLRLANTQEEMNVTQLVKDPLKSVFETTKNLIDIARDLHAMNEEKSIDYIQTSTTRQLTSKIPTSEKILTYLHHLSADYLCNLEEWLGIYDTPIEFTLENEKVWPVEPFLKVRRGEQEERRGRKRICGRCVMLTSTFFLVSSRPSVLNCTVVHCSCQKHTKSQKFQSA